MDNLKLYRFVWNNDIDLKISLKAPPLYFRNEAMVVIATNEKEALELLRKSNYNMREIIRRQASRPVSEVEEIIVEEFLKIFARDALTVQEFELKDGLIV